MANQTAVAPLPPDENQGPMLLATIWVFYSLALVCFVTRFGSRLYSNFKLTAADWTCAVAMVSRPVPDDEDGPFG